MKFLFSILALLLTVKECDQKTSKTNLSEAELAKNNKMFALQQEEPTILYTASTRGFQKEIKINKSELTIKTNKRGSESEETRKLTSEDWDSIIQEIKDIQVSDMSKWESPTTNRYVDAATTARLKIVYADTTFSSNSFDGGNPPEKLKPLCDAILKLSEKDSSEKKSSEETNIQGKYSVVFISDLNDDDFKDKGLTINFTDNAKVSGFNGCNNYSADCTIENNSISVGIMMTTKRYCQDEMEIGGKLMAKLRAANRFIIKENTVTLLDENEVLIKAEKTTEKE